MNNKRVVVITGAGSGIGRELAIQYAAKGASVVLLDRSADNLASSVEAINATGGDATSYEVDVSDYEQLQNIAKDVASTLGGVDILINNAGVSLIDSVEHQSIQDFKWLMDINFWGVVYGTKAFLPYIKQSSEGHIANVSSLFGLLSLPLQSAYNASKFAVRGFTESLKMEMAGTSVQVHCIHPGGIKTNITSSAKVSSNEVSHEQIQAIFEAQAKTTAGDAAQTIITNIEKNKRRILIGRDAKILDRIARWFPASYEKILKLEAGVIANRKRKAQKKNA